jgi:CBS domain containing-hemolysin-like protein
MRPRTQFLSFRPPVSLADLGGRVPPSGYLLVTEPDSDEVAGAIPLRSLAAIPSEHLGQHANKVIYVPWCSTVADALQEMRERNLQVAAVINEFGETIGILTFDDILDTIFSHSPSRSQRLLKREPIRQVAPGVWHVIGITSLRRLVRFFRVERPSSKSVTVAGVIQETLERLPSPGDRCTWGPFQFRVIDVQPSGQLLAEVTLGDVPREQAE